MNTTVKQLLSYIIVAIIATLLVGCTPEEMKAGLDDARFYVQGTKYVGVGMIPGSDYTEYIVGTMEQTHGAYVVKAAVGDYKAALDTAMAAYGNGYKSITFWQLPDDFKPWVVGELLSAESLPFNLARIRVGSFFVVPMIPQVIPPFEGCSKDDAGAWYCNQQGG